MRVTPLSASSCVTVCLSVCPLFCLAIKPVLLSVSNASCPSILHLLCVQQSHVPVRSTHQSGGCNRWGTMKEQKLQPVRVHHAAQTYWQLRDCIANSLFNEVCNITGNQTQIKWLERLDVFFSRASAHVTIRVKRHLLYTQIASSKSGG